MPSLVLSVLSRLWAHYEGIGARSLVLGGVPRRVDAWCFEWAEQTRKS
jgi:hypothetical protein